MAKHKLDEGLKFLRLMNIQKYNSIHTLNEEVIRRFGKEDGMRFIHAYDDLIDADLNDDEKGFRRYELKNENTEFSIFFTGAYSEDIIRQCCNWIFSHKECFGETILEVGCDNGIMSCFLAMTFPESHITSIDRGENWFPVAEHLAERLHLNNITFKKASAADMVGEKFDTVFSMRTVQENRIPVDEKGTDLPSKLAKRFEEQISGYAGTLSDLIKDNGTLISLERIDKDPLLLAWMYAVDEAKCKIDFDTIIDLSCIELGEKMNITTFVAYKGAKHEKKSIYNKWISLFELNLIKGRIYGWDASVYREVYGGDRIKAYNVYNPVTDENVGLFEICKLNNDADKILLYFDYGGGSETQLLVGSKEEFYKFENTLMGNLEHNKSVGLNYRSIM